MFVLASGLALGIVCFAAPGRGHITAKTEAARLVITGQMITDLVVIGIGVRGIVAAVRRGQRQRPAGAGAAQPNE